MDDRLIIADQEFSSRLLIGTGKFPSMQSMQASIKAAGSEIITVALRRTDLENDQDDFLAHINPKDYVFMPNTSGARTAEEAIRLARIGKISGVSNWVKLELTPEPHHLLPDPIGTLKAADYLVRAGFTVLPYINADPVLASHLEDLGCATLMPLGSPIGSGQGLKNSYNISLIIDNAKIPVIVDAGIRTPSQAAEVMEMGASAVLLNTAVAKSLDPVNMAYAMAKGVEGGHLAHYAGSMSTAQYAKPSSPSTGLFL